MVFNLNDIDDEQFAALTSEVEKRASSNTIFKPIFTHELSADEWKLVEQYAAQLNADYEQRAQLSLKRLDVTIDAFLWSDRTKKLEDKIMKLYSPVRAELVAPPPVEVDDMLAATTDLLIIEKASSKQVRLDTLNQFSAYTVREQPRDRGGRTAEMVAPPPDAPYWLQQKQQQQQPRHNRDGGGGGQHRRGGGGGFFQQYRGQRNDHVESKVRQSQSHPYRDGGGYGRGRGRGGGPRN